MSDVIIPPPARVAESDRRTAARADGAPAGGGITRRTFLKSAPRRLLSGVAALMDDVAAVTWPAAGGPECPARRQVAVVDASRCLAWSGTDCRMCYLTCPKRDEAIALDEGRPLIMASVCDGCGVCVEACGSVNDLDAIQLVDVTRRRVTT